MPSVRQSNLRRSTSSRTSRQPSTRLENVRTGLQQLFTGRSSVGLARNSSPESPKSPQYTLGLQHLSSSRINIPYLIRTTTIPNSSNESPSVTSPVSAPSPTTPISTRPITSNSLRQQIQHPDVSTNPSHGRHDSARRFVGIDPADEHLAELAEHGRRRRRRNKSRTSYRRCAPKIKSRKIRSKILSCFISGLFLTLVLTIYLALALSNRNESQEFHVLLILVILVTTIFFCHSLIRLCMMIIHPPGDDDLDARTLPSIVGPGGYANPEVPIRVALARDEEAVGIESEATKFPPPAYGLWRESVRVDPNRIFWQRNESALQRQNSHTEGRPSIGNRPPSYISENGVDYIIEAAPRSIAPTTDVPLPPHPSERGRVLPSQIP